MRELVIVFVLFAVVAAQSDGMGGQFCNYTARGDEIVENAVPIATFATSEANTTRPTWCIAYCQERTCLKATMKFQPANKNSATFQRKVSFTTDGKRVVDMKQTSGLPTKHRELHDESCKDSSIDLKIDEVFIKYKGIDTLAAMLDKYINKPGWAYLVYELIPYAGGDIATENVVEDDNFCMITKSQVDNNGQRADFQVFAGLVQN